MRKRKSNKANSETLIRQENQVEEEDDKGKGFFACYLLTSLSPRFKGHTYIGFTVNPKRRIRQHNGEIRSGAFRTKRRRPWEMVLCIYGFQTNVAALQFEWAWQHPTESLAVRKAAANFKSFSGIANKVKLAYTMLNLPTWQSLNLTVNYFSTKYFSQSAGCPSLPESMKVQLGSMDDLPCYNDNEGDTNLSQGAYDEDRWNVEKGFDEASDASPMASTAGRNEALFEDFWNVEKEFDEASNASLMASTAGRNEALFEDCWNVEKVFDEASVASPMASTVGSWNVEKEFDETSNASPTGSTAERNDALFEGNVCLQSSDIWRSAEEPYIDSVSEKNEVTQSMYSLTPLGNKSYAFLEASIISPSSSFSMQESMVCKDMIDYIKESITNSNRQFTSKETSVDGKQQFNKFPVSHDIEVVDLLTPSPSYRIRSCGSKKVRVSIVCPEIIDLT